MYSDNYKSNNVMQAYDRLMDDLNKKFLSKAFADIENMAATANAPWKLRDEIENLRAAYDYMIKYVRDGVDDPDRKRVYADIVNGIRRVGVMIMRHADKKDKPTLYFNTLRYEESQLDSTVAGLVKAYENLSNRMSVNMLTGVMDDGLEQLRQTEAAARRLFNKVWVTYPLSHDDEEAIKQLFASEIVGKDIKILVLSAILMGALEYYDETRMVIMAEAYVNNRNSFGIRALCAFMLSFWHNRSHECGSRLASRISAMSDIESWQRDAFMVFMQLLRAQDTERINRKMTTEVIPQMQKISPDIYNKIKEMGASDEFSNLEGNPEWEEILEKSGLADKIKEMTEMQAQGDDVMMVTFSHLKTFPFFQEIANWFLPFSPEHSAIAAKASADTSTFAEIIASSPVLCNSDKYSMALSLESIPDAQRRMAMEQLNAQTVNIAELRNMELRSEERALENTANKYVQDLYRFFKLFRRKGEFHDPFVTPMRLYSMDTFEPVFTDEGRLRIIAEFYFRRGYYDMASDVFHLLLSHTESATADIYQKLGYSAQKIGDWAQAVEYYKKADMLRPDNEWTLRRLVQCCKQIGMVDEAIGYCKRLSSLVPDDMNIALNYGHCLLLAGDYFEAMSQYFKAEYLDKTGKKAVRAIAWCSFVAGDYDRSREYYAKMQAVLEPTSSDLLNMGHLEFVSGNTSKAIELYAASMVADERNTGRFDDQMLKDRRYLEEAGVDALLVDIVKDYAIKIVEQR